MANNKFLEKVVQIYKSFSGPKQSLDQFAKGMQNLAINLERGVRLEIASEMCDLHKDIVDSTPWDTGLAQANWQISDRRNSEILHKEVLETKNDRPYYEIGLRILSPAKTPNPSKFLSSKKMYVFNNLDYIPLLETGHSDQAPAGTMIADNVARHKLLLEASLKNTGVFK